MARPSRKKADLILICCLLILGVLGLLIAGATTGGSGSEPVVVTQSSSGFYRADPLGSTVTFTVETPTGTDTDHPDEVATNVVSLHDGMVDVTSSSCDNQQCVDHDPIDEVGEQIVCLPHGVVIEIVADEKDASKLM